MMVPNDDNNDDGGSGGDVCFNLLLDFFCFQSSGRYHEDIFGVTLKTREVTDRVRSAAKRFVA